jgi:hypothetical protein
MHPFFGFYLPKDDTHGTQSQSLSQQHPSYIYDHVERGEGTHRKARFEASSSYHWAGKLGYTTTLAPDLVTHLSAYTDIGEYKLSVPELSSPL